MNHHATVAKRPASAAPTQDVLDFYASQSALAAPGRHAGLSPGSGKDHRS